MFVLDWIAAPVCQNEGKMLSQSHLVSDFVDSLERSSHNCDQHVQEMNDEEKVG